MASVRSSNNWSFRPAFLLATVGAAVGLGNLWRFPFVAGENGGGAFVLVYLSFVLLLGVPIMMAELAIGRRGGHSPVATLRKLSRDEGANRHWQVIGWLSIIIPLVGLSYYSVVAGWALDYIVKGAANSFSGFDGTQSEQAFNHLLSSPLYLILLHTLFIGGAVLIVSRGIHGGIERISKIMMPTLFLLLVIMVINSIVAADIEAGMKFLFSPDFSKLTPATFVIALGQAFFSVAIGVGVLMTYGSYMPKQFSLAGSAITIALADTCVALLAGLAIFPVVFQYGLNPGGGPGLIFVTLPVAFGQMPGGHLLGLLFFILLFFAAFSTAIGMLEPVVSWFTDRGMKRPLMAAWSGAAAWGLGLAAVLSFNLWSHIRLLDGLPLLGEKDIFELLDFIISNLMLPLNALLIALFAGWIMSRHATLNELQIADNWLFKYWRFSIRFIAPVAIAIVAYNSITG